MKLLVYQKYKSENIYSYICHNVINNISKYFIFNHVFVKRFTEK